MAYQTYITEAIVCGVTNSNTANRSYLLFTRDAGMVYAHAQSVREERSKHRYGLQECSYVRVTLVRGKSGWRIVGVEPLQNFYTIAETRESRACVRNVLLLIKRCIQGETPHESIFHEVVHTCLQIGKYSPRTLELVLSLRMLHTLGYVSGTELDIQQMLTKSIDEVVQNELSTEEEETYRALSIYALKESHL